MLLFMILGITNVSATVFSQTLNIDLSLNSRKLLHLLKKKRITNFCIAPTLSTSIKKRVLRSKGVQPWLVYSPISLTVRKLATMWLTKT